MGKFLTDKGRELRLEIWTGIQEWNALITDGLMPGEIAAAEETLQKMAENAIAAKTNHFSRLHKNGTKQRECRDNGYTGKESMNGESVGSERGLAR